MKEEIPDFDECRAQIVQNQEKFTQFYRMLLQYNAAFNLTAITREEEVFHKHFLDSLAGGRRIPQGASVAEVGSGAGFPSVPLSIVRPDLSFTLIESTGKKCQFLKTVAEALGLRITVCQMRAEDAGRDAAFRERFDCAIARAVAPLPTLAEYCLPLVKKGGSMIAWKGSEDETDAARNAVRILGGGNVRAVRYTLPEGYGDRMLVLAEKLRETPAKYPRGQGKERKSPLL